VLANQAARSALPPPTPYLPSPPDVCLLAFKTYYRAYVLREQTARLSGWETERGAASPVCTDGHALAIEVQLASVSHHEGRTLPRL
jgi:hypothetical protein